MSKPTSRRLFGLLLYLLSAYSYAEVSTSASLSGASGYINSPAAFVQQRGHGMIGFWETLDQRREDRLYFLYGVRNWLEVGVLSDIPHQNRIDLLFKINSEAQDKLFKGFPLLAFGIYRSNSYLSASYKIYPLTFNIGSYLSQRDRPVFTSASIDFTQYLQFLIDTNGDQIGIGLRGQYKRIQLSLLMDSQVDDTIENARLNWGAAFIF